MDHAALTDNTGGGDSGTGADLTSNAGSRAEQTIGFADRGVGDAHDERVRKAATRSAASSASSARNSATGWAIRRSARCRPR